MNKINYKYFILSYLFGVFTGLYIIMMIDSGVTFRVFISIIYWGCLITILVVNAIVKHVQQEVKE